MPATSLLYIALKFVKRDILFKKLIAALTILAIASGVATFVSLRILSVGSRTAAQNIVEQVLPGEVIVYGQGLYDVSEDVLNDIRRLPGVKDVTPVILVTGYIERNAVFVLGVRPQDLKNVVSRFTSGSGFTTISGSYAVADVGLARRLNLSVGDRVAVKPPFGGFFRQYEIIGIAEVTMKIEEIGAAGGYIILPLREAQNLLGRPGYVSMAVVKVEDGVDPVAVKNLISMVYPGSRVMLREEVIGVVFKIMSLIEGLLLSTTLVGLAVAVFGTTSTITSTVREHQREIAIMRTQGASRASVAAIFMLEALLYGVSGGLLGLLFGVAGARIGIEIVSSYGFLNPPLILEAQTLVLGVALATALSVLASVYPVWRATSIRPVEVLKSE
ncbi:ABC transporter permease [Infirmifilum lucidum]|uniref:ABC transporter permease n=1 Tax=Infirmifilum lucidum TaxID=2776706 RepID=A0A7L9FG18_9CREN|nr:FtsX-like permease family protein [Infirmifilum lucidum]QOJ78689.1 ABC transporter permease [Infirmifilum lucidum]